MGGIGAVAEPLVVITLLFGGTWINRAFTPGRRRHSVPSTPPEHRLTDPADAEESVESPRSTSPSLLTEWEPKWHTRQLGIWGAKMEVTTPNTRRFRGYFLSRLLEKFPFLVEVWYWGLIYWVYQLGRAASALLIVESTVVAAEKHALQVIAVEEKLHILFELNIQKFFMQHAFLMTWINRTYSFIHIPGSIAFLVWLFYYTNTGNRPSHNTQERLVKEGKGSVGVATPRLYEARRRTMAFCNLLAFIIFTLWPCMPPRLLSADNSDTEIGRKARSYGFVDTVHGPLGEGSIWTDNRFTNKFAAMPSLHFGYSLLIGLTIMTIPLSPSISSTLTFRIPFILKNVRIPLGRRVLCVAIGVFYPSLILLAILATANHFILDAVAGATVCGLAWWGNNVMLNLLVVEDWFLWVVRIHRPEREEEEDEWFDAEMGVRGVGELHK